MVEATKRLYQGLPAPARAKRRMLAPVLVPQGTAGAAREQAAGHVASGNVSFDFGATLL
jgi:hypothetical protein